MKEPQKPPSVEFYLPVKTVSESNQREHWSVRHKRVKGQREHAYVATRQALMSLSKDHPVKLGKPSLNIFLTRVGSRRRDADNNVSSLKAVQDGVAQGLGIDDGDPRLSWTYSQRKPEKGQARWGVVVTIEVYNPGGYYSVT